MVEAAVVMGLVLLIIAGVIQAALAYHTTQRVDATAARAVEAAQVAGGSVAAGEDAATRVLAGAPLNEPEVTVELGSDVVTATVAGTVPQLVPGLDWRITRHAEAPLERFLPEPERE